MCDQSAPVAVNDGGRGHTANELSHYQNNSASDVSSGFIYPLWHMVTAYSVTVPVLPSVRLAVAILCTRGCKSCIQATFELVTTVLILLLIYCTVIQ